MTPFVFFSAFYAEIFV
ncbi:hypothetical protein CGLO_09053 [Colletotrichum gloeosporioides Cg-14]|uniref:Uncharacterized protein n=1 Tax=Colletotrichum gloeosporioides (strain Cg-14) TaxID=1237896 RepID=T0KH13_COLGC|nr:hypothetical protein CGLO_09053 [Colletotrichum gloeosporioides Cg-14]